MPEVRDWEAVHARAYRQLRRTATRLVSWQDAEDLVQDTFVRALEGECGFRSEATLTTWLHRILVNLSIDRLRRKRRRGVHVEIGPWTAGTYSIDPANACAVRDAWRALTDRQRAVSYLHDVAGFTHQEIGRRLHIGVGNSKRTLFDARRRLRRRLAERVS